MNMLKKIKAIISIEFKNNYVYKAKTIFYAMLGIIQFVAIFYLWNAIYSNNLIIDGYNKSEMLNYTIISYLITLILPKFITKEIGWKVKDGSINDILIKPYSLKTYYFFYSISDLIFMFIFIGIPVLVVSLYKGLLLNTNYIICFFITLIFAYIINYLISYILGLSSFWLTNNSGIYQAYEIVLIFLSGGIIPINMFSKSLIMLLNILPFSSIYSTPIEIYLNKYNNSEIFNKIMVQLIWIIILNTISNYIYKKARYNLDSLGG